jgi:hypothetical protein
MTQAGPQVKHMLRLPEYAPRCPEAYAPQADKLKGNLASHRQAISHPLGLTTRPQNATKQSEGQVVPKVRTLKMA